MIFSIIGGFCLGRLYNVKGWHGAAERSVRESVVVVVIIKKGKNSMKKKKFELKSFSLILFIGLLLLAGLFPFYECTVEGSKAAAAVSVLLNVATAENQYFIKHKTYTYDWSALDKHLPRIPKKQGFLGAAPEAGQARFFAFTAQDTESGKDGFALDLQLNKEKTEGTATAVRKGGLFDYTLEMSLPEGLFTCQAEGKIAKRLCNKLTVELEKLRTPQRESPATPEEEKRKNN